MNHVVLFLVAGTLVSGGGATAQTPPPSPSTSTTLRMIGTIERYEPATHRLSLSARGTSTQFTLASTTRIHQGWRKIDDVVLKTLIGNRAVIRYSETSGGRTVESVRVWPGGAEDRSSTTGPVTGAAGR